MSENQPSSFFNKASRLLKYFLLTAFGFAIAIILAQTLGAPQIAEMLISKLGMWFLGAAAVVICLMASASIFEAFRQ